MNETSKTVIFVAVACVAVLIAFLVSPPVVSIEDEDLRGKQLFPDFSDALEATGIEIVKYDEKTAKVQPFKVEQVKGLWSIPSHEDYPADAKDQLAAVAADMVDLMILEEASDKPGDQGLFGVVDPQKVESGDTGVGMLVKMWGKDEKTLMSLIIGKEEPDQDGLHYVRKPDKDQIYLVKIDTEKLTTRFQDWIEEDLLKLNPFDISGVEVFDYSGDLGIGRDGIPTLNVAERGRFAVDYDDMGDPRWKLRFLERFVGGEKGFVPESPPADEELNTKKLGAMKTALDDLKIVDVKRKPKGLSGDLRADKSFLEDQEAVGSLARRGFYLTQVGDEGAYALYSSEGEMRVQMKDGVCYVLRFGEIAAGTGSVDDKKKGEKGEEVAEEASSGLNRYLFVMAEFNEEAIPKPDIEPLPLDKPVRPEGESAAPAEEKPAETAPAPPEAAAPAESPAKPAGSEGNKETVIEKPVEEKADVEKPAEEKPAEAKPADAEEKPAAEPEKKPEGDPPTEPADAEKPAEEAKPAEAKPDAEPKVETPPADATPAPDAEPADAKPAEEKPAEPVMSPEDLKAERERIERDNKRKEEEYQEKVKKGKERVKELNDRFADWYYVISDEVYQKIHVTRENLFAPKEEPAAPGGAPAPGDFSPGALDQLRGKLPKP